RGRSRPVTAQTALALFRSLAAGALAPVSMWAMRQLLDRTVGFPPSIASGGIRAQARRGSSPLGLNDRGRDAPRWSHGKALRSRAGGSYTSRAAAGDRIRSMRSAPNARDRAATNAGR